MTYLAMVYVRANLYIPFDGRPTFGKISPGDLQCRAWHIFVSLDDADWTDWCVKKMYPITVALNEMFPGGVVLRCQAVDKRGKQVTRPVPAVGEKGKK